MINVFNISNYKKCREKKFKSYFCLPEQDSYVINKLEKTEEWIKLGKRSFISKDNMDKLQFNNKNAYEFVLRHGKRVENGCFVISGVVGELDIISFKNLASQFVYNDGSPITKESIMNILSKCKYFDWVGVTSKRTLNAIAYHIENKNSEKININNKICGVNLPGIDHGKGDFAVCYVDNNGQPLPQTLKIYNGIEFKEKFDNRGWQNVLGTREIETTMPDSIIRHLTNGNALNKVNDFKGSQLMQVIEQILAWCKKTIHRDIKWEYKKIAENKFSVAASVVEAYKKENDCTHVVSTIEVKDKEIEFIEYNIKDTNKKKALSFSLTINNATADKLVEDRCVYFGILGYIRGDVPSLLKVKGELTKSEYDGIERYTVSSAGINRVCRGLDNPDEKAGELRGDVLRTILQIDRALEKSSIGTNVTLFRGTPLDIAYKLGKCNEETLDRATIPNTAFTSTSLNLQSTIMFALPIGTREGLVQIIDNNIGINGMYISNMAGWEEQYEILVDRCYDLQNNNYLMDIKTGSGNVKVVRASFVMHRPLGNVNSESLAEKGIFNYDEFGRIGLYKELFDNITHEVFDLLREKGLSNAQYIEKTSLADIDNADSSESSYIVIDAGEELNENGEKGKGIDLLYRIDPGVMNGNIITIYKIRGDRKALRNYWFDRNRHKGKVDYNYRWSTYNYQKLNKGDINTDNTEYIMVDSEENAETIAEAIYNDIVYRKNVVAFPLLDIARYFGQVFQQFVVQEGYVLKQSFRIDRIGRDDDPQDGYVPVRFRIDGDNDDDLLLQIVFKRDENGELNLRYRGQSASKKVNESKSYNYNTFNTEVANKVAEQILYTFVKKLNLSCVSKLDRFIEQYCIRNGFKNIRVQQDAEKDRNGAYYKKYRMIRVPEAYNILGIKILGGEYKLMISNKIAKEMLLFNHQSSMREINKMFKITLNKLRDESSFHDLMNTSFEEEKENKSNGGIDHGESDNSNGSSNEDGSGSGEVVRNG